MQLLPAIDVLNGQVVRLAQGDYEMVTIYAADPVAQACSFAEQGAQWLHLVDLEGARTGASTHFELIAQIVRESGLLVEVGGGIRSLSALERLVKTGVQRVVIGTALITNPDFCRSAVREFGSLICAGVDAREGKVAIQGWQQGSEICATELVEQLADWGIRHLVYTDIARDGMQTGIDALAYRSIAQAAGFAVIASGGIATLADLSALAALGDKQVEGIIVGRALYEENFTVAQALEALRTC